MSIEVKFCLLCSTLLYSCYAYEKIPISVEQSIPVSRNFIYEFSIENDSILKNEIKIDYYFSNCSTVSTIITNISKQDLYVDLGRSSFIINGFANNYTRTLSSENRYLYIPNSSTLATSELDFKIPKKPLEKPIQFDIDSVSFTKRASPLAIRNQLQFSHHENFTDRHQLVSVVWLEKATKSTFPDDSNEGLKTSCQVVRMETSTTTTYKEERKYSKSKTTGMIITAMGIIALISVVASS